MVSPPASPEQASALLLVPSEVKRRLRRLGEPATFFGEDSDVRKARLLRAEATLEVHDEDAGAGERANVLLSIQKEDRERAKRSDTGEIASQVQDSEGPQRPGSASTQPGPGGQVDGKVWLAPTMIAVSVLDSRLYHRLTLTFFLLQNQHCSHRFRV
jgi:hypothetical protein